MPDARGRIYGYIDFPKKDMENLSVEGLILKVYLFNAPRYSVSISPMKNGTFSFDNLYLGSGPYRIEVIPSKISVDDNIIAVYEPLNITFDYYATPKHVILERRIDLNYKIISKNGTLDFQNAFKELSS
ncbi:MAG: hypothetical protein Q8O46_01910 [bacterium]|nr:hypothetical protein [bacterium]